MNRVQERIEQCRLAFASNVTTDGTPYPPAKQADDEVVLELSPVTAREYYRAITWGLSNGHLGEEERWTILGHIKNGTWAHHADLAAKVTVTKVCEELAQLRGDA